jgi:hypothetical protein
MEITISVDGQRSELSDVVSMSIVHYLYTPRPLSVCDWPEAGEIDKRDQHHMKARSPSVSETRYFDESIPLRRTHDETSVLRSFRRTCFPISGNTTPNM